MENNNVRKYGIAVFLFLICVSIGFFVSKMFLNQNASSKELAQDKVIDNSLLELSDSTPVIKKGDPKGEHNYDASTTQGEDIKRAGYDAVMRITPPQLDNGSYSFNASCQGANKFHLYSNGGKKFEMESKNGSFSHVIVKASNYIVVALDAQNNAIAKQEVLGLKPVAGSSTSVEAGAASPKLSFAELASIINNQKNQNYPRNITIKYTNLEPGEEAQQSINNIRGYFRSEVWKSVTVVGATYDASGKVTSLTLQITRPEKQE